MKTSTIVNLQNVKIKPEIIRKSKDKPKIILGAGKKYGWISDTLFNDDLLNWLSISLTKADVSTRL